MPVWKIPSNKRHIWSNICRVVKFMGSILIYHRLAIGRGYAPKRCVKLNLTIYFVKKLCSKEMKSQSEEDKR